MNFYRIKQFYWAMGSSISMLDIEFVKNKLTLSELDLFYRLSVSEQKHSIRVAYDVENMCMDMGINPKILVKAALLHDIGKTYKRLNIIDKSIIVIVDNITRGSIKQFSSISKLDVYYNHAKIGYDILKKYINDNRLLYLVKNHHNDKIKGDIQLNILRICDSIN
jgi:putative nucleotidyltransferase with HDIG domain